MFLKSETKVGLFVLIAIAILIFMAMKLDVFKLNISEYKSHIIYFKKFVTIDKKADVKISGVKVGWIQSIDLNNNGNEVIIKIMIQKKFFLYHNASAKITKDGFLGSKYLELIPGDSNYPIIEKDEIIHVTNESCSFDNLMLKFEKIANNIQDISEKFKSIICNENQPDQIKLIVDNISQVTKKISTLTDVLLKNENNLNNTIKNINEFSNNLAPLCKDLNTIAKNFEQNFKNISTTLNSTIENADSVIKKIDEGKGTLGKLINKDEVYTDFSVVTNKFRSFSDSISKMKLFYDSHFESLINKDENFFDSKGYFNLLFLPRKDIFGLFQLLATERGTIIRSTENKKIINNAEISLECKDINVANNMITLESTKRIRNTVKFGLQFGKIYKNLAFRFGIFENSFGAAIDFLYPCYPDNVRLISSLELFDFRGLDRINDCHPHLKWINRLFLFKNLYCDFGIDDFISKKNLNAFFGLGLAFG